MTTRTRQNRTTFFVGSFGSHAIEILMANGLSKKQARQFIMDETSYDSERVRNAQEQVLLCKVLGINPTLRDEFYCEVRLQRAFMALLKALPFPEISATNARYMEAYILDHLQRSDPDNLLDDVFDRFLRYDIHSWTDWMSDKPSLTSLREVFWDAHGMGPEITHAIYPQEGYVHDAVTSAIDVMGGYDEVASTAHAIYASVADGMSFTQAADQALDDLCPIWDDENEAARQSFWGTLHLEVQNGTGALLPW